MAVLVAGCGSSPSQTMTLHAQDAVDSCAISLLPHQGGGTTDERIRRYQDLARDADDNDPRRTMAWLERLGWSYVEAARLSQDPGLLTLAEHTAHCVRDHAMPAQHAAADLLLGHVRHQQHRFDDAERIARGLVAARGHWLDQALLGDVLLERGDLSGAREAYQRLADQRPGPQAYQRAGELRWWSGDVRGARDMLARALSTLHTSDPSSLAVVAVRLAELQWQLGEHSAATRTLDGLAKAHADFAPAEYLRGRMLLARGEVREAVTLLRAATERTGWPLHRWALIEALRSAGQAAAAQAQEAQLLASTHDPRARALYLATHGLDVTQATALAERALGARRDPLTRSTAALVALRAGDLAVATSHHTQVAATGVRDARVCLHGALLHQRLMRAQAVAEQMACVREYQHTLLPSERALFDRLVTTQTVAREAIETLRQPSS